MEEHLQMNPDFPPKPARTSNICYIDSAETTVEKSNVTHDIYMMCKLVILVLHNTTSNSLDTGFKVYPLSAHRGTQDVQTNLRGHLSKDLLARRLNGRSLLARAHHKVR